MTKHEARCWWNPARRACVTCGHYRQYMDSNGMDGTASLEEWRVRECVCDDLDVDLSEKLRHDCPHWVSAKPPESVTTPAGQAGEKGR